MGLINDSISTDAYKKMIDLSYESRKYGSSRCLSIVGVLQGAETVSLEIPVVLEPDEDTDADWTPLIQFNAVSGTDEAVIFVASGENAKIIPADLIVRVVKTATTSDVGVMWS